MQELKDILEDLRSSGYSDDYVGGYEAGCEACSTPTVKIDEFINKQFKGARLEDIAKELGLSIASVSKYKRGENLVPSIRVAKKIYKTYDVVLFPYIEEALGGVEND